jgi:hypothetical protein
MSTLVDTVASVQYQGGQIIVAMESGVELRFPVAANARLAKGTPKQLNHVEVSPYGLHWPDLDEDLSFRGLLAGDYGQDQAPHADSCRRRPAGISS